MRRKTDNPVRKYVETRIEWLVEERSKNDCEDTHRILDKTIDELYIVLDLIDRKAPLL
jgi:hypothetical protein